MFRGASLEATTVGYEKILIGRLENYCFPEVVRNFISPYICFFSVCNIVHLLSLLFTRNRKVALIKRLFNKRLNNCNWMPLLMKSNYKARFAFCSLNYSLFLLFSTFRNHPRSTYIQNLHAFDQPSILYERVHFRHTHQLSFY